MESAIRADVEAINRLRWVTIKFEPAHTVSWVYGKDEAFAAVFQEMEDIL